MTSRTVNYTLEFTDKTSSTVKNVTAAVQGLGTASTAALGQLANSTTTANTAMERLKVSVTETERSASSLHSSSSNMFEGFLKAQVVTEALSLLRNGITAVVTDSIALAGGAEQAQVGFTNLLHSGQAATGMLNELRQFANASPFNFLELQADAEHLLGVGEAARKIIPDLKDVGNEIAGRGASQAQLQETMLAYEQVISKGHLAGQEAMQFQNALIPVWQIVATYIHKTADETENLASQGKITSQILQDAFHADAVTNFSTAMENQSQTWNGLMSTAQDLGQTLETTFGAGIIQELEPRLKGALAALSDPKIAAEITKWGQEAGQFAGWIFDAATWVAQMVGGPLPQLTTLTQAAATGAGEVAKQWDGVLGKAGGVKDEVAGIRAAVAGMRDDVATVDAGFAAQSAAIRNTQAEYNAGAAERIAAVNAEKTASDQASQSRLAGLHAQVNSLQEAYRLEDERIALTRAQTQLGADTALAGDIFSSAGASARSRILGDRQAVADSERKISRQSALDGLQDKITAEEAAKRTADQGFAARLTALETERRRTDANFASELRGIEDRKRAYDAASAERIRMDEAAIRAIEAANAASTTAIVNTRKQGDDLSSRYAVAAQQSVAVQGDSIMDRYGETRAAKLPDFMSKLFGTPSQQADAGSNLMNQFANGMQSSLPSVTDVGMAAGKALVDGLTKVIDQALAGGGSVGATHNMRVFRDILKGDWGAAWTEANATGAPATVPGIIGGGGIAGTGAQPAKAPNDPPPPGHKSGHWVMVSGKPVWVEDLSGGATSSGSFGGTVPYTVPAGDSRPPQVVIHVGSIIGTDTGDLARTISEQIANQTRGRH